MPWAKVALSISARGVRWQLGQYVRKITAKSRHPALYVNLDNVLSISQKSEGSVVILLMVNGERLACLMGSPEKIIEGGTKQD